jgi:hypothetical protein
VAANGVVASYDPRPQALALHDQHAIERILGGTDGFAVVKMGGGVEPGSVE